MFGYYWATSTQKTYISEALCSHHSVILLQQVVLVQEALQLLPRKVLPQQVVNFLNYFLDNHEIINLITLLGFETSSFGSSFGSTPNSAFGTSTPSTAFGFGSTSNTGAQPASGSFGSFGSTPSMSTASTSQATTGFGAPAVGFPSTTQPTSSFGTSTGFVGGFGSPSIAPATTFSAGGFGGTTASTAKPFGATSGFSTTGAAPTIGFGTAGGFGSATPGFGSGFGSNPTSGFGIGTGSTFSSGGSGFSGGGGGFNTAGSASLPFTSLMPHVVGTSQPGMQPQVNIVVQEFERLQSCYAGSREVLQSNNYSFPSQPAPESRGKYQLSMDGKPNEDCELKAIMYRKKGDLAVAGESLLKGRQLEQAEQDNMDPENLIPVLEFGIDPLKKRFDHQVSEAEKTEEYVKTLNDIVSAIEASSTQVVDSGSNNLFFIPRVRFPDVCMFNNRCLSSLRR